MLDRVTVKDITKLAGRIERELRAAGLIRPEDKVVLEQGSEKLGLNWGLWVYSGENGGRLPSDTLGLGHIGISRRGAYNVLVGFVRALDVLSRQVSKVGA